MRSLLTISIVTCVALAGCGQGGVEDLTTSRPAGNAAGTAQKDQKSAKPEVNMASTSQPADGGVHKFVFKDIDGKDKPLADYKGKVLLIVNVASKCGYTKQYTGLEKLYEKYQGSDLVVLGFPSNDFGGQEPGTPEEIKTFCSTKYQVTFPLMSKSPVKNGSEQNEVYQYLSKKSENGVLDAKVSWNFNKFLVSRDGHVLKHYDSKVTPESPELTGDIETALKR